MSLVVTFALMTVISATDLPVKVHGTFADEKACEYAASIVEQNVHPIPRGVAIVCREKRYYTVYNSNEE